MILLHVDYFSDVLGRGLRATVVLPQCAPPDTGFKTLWLLHGRSDDCTIWQRRSSIERYAQDYNIAVVMPEGERGLWSNCRPGGPRYWDALEEVFTVTRHAFPLSTRREDNAVAGLSMGGFGTFKLAFRHPDWFFGAAAMSAVTDPQFWFNPEFSDIAEAGMILGSPEEADAEGCNPFLLVADMINQAQCAPPRLLQMCGTEDFLLADNRRFAAHLKNIGYPDCDYREFPGAHSWEFWDEHIRDALAYLFGK